MISLIIPSFKRHMVLSGTLINLLHQSIFKAMNFEILISLDAIDPTQSDYSKLISQIKSIYSDNDLQGSIKIIINQTQGLVEAKNAAISQSKSPYIMMLDDDLYPEPNYIETLYQDIISYPQTGAVSGYIVTYLPAISHTQPSTLLKLAPQSTHLQTLKLKRNANQWRSVFGTKEQVMDWSQINHHLPKQQRYTMDYFVNSYLFSRQAFDQINGYNPQLNSATSAHEEVDFTYRIGKSGYKLLFNPFARMWHLTIGKGGIYKGQTYQERQKIIESEYNAKLPVFFFLFT